MLISLDAKLRLGSNLVVEGSIQLLQTMLAVSRQNEAKPLCSVRFLDGMEDLRLLKFGHLSAD